MYLENSLKDYKKKLVSVQENNKGNKPNTGKKVIQKEKIPDYISNPGKNKLTQKGIDDSKDVDKLLAKINKDLK